jgi:hypothetical protein
MEGGAEMEKQLHAQFAPYRLAGEWFSPAAELMEFINAI